MKNIKNKNTSINTIICRYLFTYRNTPYSETQDSPSKLMFGRKTKTHLDLLLVNSEKKEDNQRKYFKGERVAEFKEGEEVYARNYRNSNRKEWKKARVIEVMGARTYLVEEATDSLV
ncbi:hypothetical protein QE152_g36643 [Popillia japonica]|uniref:Uncharacterized protein n=1 Tax=Popillia japonica TaxID=7064 RepID=A0AAW1ID32_POPJA